MNTDKSKQFATSRSDSITHIDLNCDMGEGIGNDELIFPFISSANVACGYHAGDEQIMHQTIELAIQHNVAVGAHVSFLDKENFGRSEMELPATTLYEIIQDQLRIIKDVADSYSIKLSHVKPHGALYNMSARNAQMAETIARAIKDFDKDLLLFGLSGSHSIQQAQTIGLRTANEVFADRTYRDDGNLTPRSVAGALIENASESETQVLQMIKEKTVTTVSGKKISIEADTICIHGDGKHAVDFAKNIFASLKQNNIAIKAI